MTDVIQIFKWVERIEKPDYQPDTRKQLGRWPQQLESETGYLRGDQLLMPEGLQPGSSPAGLVILQDVYKPHPQTGAPWQQSPQHGLFPQPLRQLVFELFSFSRPEPDVWAIGFHYNTLIGRPLRQNHRIALLRPGAAIRFRINGMHDFSLTGRRQRTFMEFDYVIQFAGTARDILFLPPEQIAIQKAIPDCRLIDERKILK